jgi:hypothetical protein
VATPGPFLLTHDGMCAFQKSKIELSGNKKLTKRKKKWSLKILEYITKLKRLQKVTKAHGAA